MDDPGAELPAADRAVRAPADAVEAVVGHLGDEPRRQRVLGEFLAAGVAAAAVAIARRFRR